MSELVSEYIHICVYIFYAPRTYCLAVGTVLSRHSLHKPPDDGYRDNIRNVGYELDFHIADCSRMLYYNEEMDLFLQQITP
jgi:hypothetical protein